MTSWKFDDIHEKRIVNFDNKYSIVSIVIGKQIK